MSPARFFVIICAVFLAFFIVLAAFWSVSFDLPFYNHEFSSLGVYARMGTQIPRNLTLSVLDYYRGRTQQLVTPYLTQNEHAHLEAVNVLYRRGIAITYALVAGIAACLLAIVLCERKTFLRSLGSVFRLGGVIAGAIASFLLACSFFFAASFETFHEVLFPQGNFAFPSQAVITSVYTEQFFVDFTRVLLIRIFVAAAVVFILGAVILRLQQNHAPRGRARSQKSR